MLKQINEEKHAYIRIFLYSSLILGAVFGIIFLTLFAIEDATTTIITDCFSYFWVSLGLLAVAFITWLVDLVIPEESLSEDIYNRYAEEMSKCFNENKNIVDAERLLFIIFNMKPNLSNFLHYDNRKIDDLLNKFIDYKSTIRFSTRHYDGPSDKKGTELVLYYNQEEVSKLRISNN